MPAASTASRVKDLLSRMTLEEKAAQMMCVWQEKAQKFVDAEGNFDLNKARAAFKNGHGLGQVGRPSDAGGPIRNAELGRNAAADGGTDQRHPEIFPRSIRGSAFPVIFHEECLHGHAAKDATSFPQPIGLGATFNPDLVEALYAMTAEEARVRGAHQALTPVVDVARDPRWGRVEETLRRRPVSEHATGHGRRARISGRRDVQGQKTRHRHAETFCRARPAGVRA